GQVDDEVRVDPGEVDPAVGGPVDPADEGGVAGDVQVVVDADDHVLGRSRIDDDAGEEGVGGQVGVHPEPGLASVQRLQQPGGEIGPARLRGQALAAAAVQLARRREDDRGV